MILLWPGIAQHAVHVPLSNLSLMVTLRFVPLLLSAVIRPLILVVLLLTGALRPTITRLAIVVVPVVSRLLAIGILLRPLLILPGLLILQAGVIVVLLYPALLAIATRRLTIGLPILLHDDYPWLRRVYLRMLLSGRGVARAGVEVVGTATEQQG